MLAKCIQVSVKVSATEGSLKGKDIGMGGKPQERGQIMCWESLCPRRAWTVRKIRGLFLTKLFPSGSGQTPQPEHHGGQWALSAASKLSAKGPCIWEPRASSGTDGVSHQRVVSVHPSPVTRWGDRDSTMHRHSSQITEEYASSKPGFSSLSCLTHPNWKRQGDSLFSPPNSRSIS